MASYLISLNKNGGSGGTSTFYTDGSYAQTYDSNKFFSDALLRNEIFSITPPTQQQMRFLGYFKESSGGSSLIGSNGNLAISNLIAYRILTSITLYAHWSRVSWKITLDKQGGGINATSYAKNESAGHYYSDDQCKNEETSYSVPARVGYVFEGYFTGENGTGSKCTNADGSFTDYWLGVSHSENKTIFAFFTRRFTLTLDPNGGTISTPSVQVYEGQPIGTLPDPIFSPNRFLGWFTASTGGTQVTPETTYSWTTDQTVYAHWEAPHTLTFNPMGGQTSEISRSVFTGDTLGPLPEATKSGHFFDGWWTAEDGGDEITNETIYEWTTDQTFYAHWTLDEQWNLTFAANGGTVSPASKRVRPGNAVGDLPTPEYGGRQFLGWFTQPSGGDQWDEDTVFDYHQDVTLYAHWFRYEYTLRFDPNGGTVDETERTVTINEPIGELPVPSKYANEFLGWFTARDGGDQWDEDTVFELTDDTTLYAHWETDPQFVRTISLNAEGGTVSPSTVSCTYGLPVDILPTPVNYGKVFLGWFTATTGGTRYSAGTTCDWSGTLTLHAHWTDDVFGNLTDWFGLETADGPLMLVGSTDGATRSVTETSHSGALAIQTADSSVGAFERGGLLMNPTCTYRIRKEETVPINLGKAYGSATIVGTGTTSNPYRATKSGYMLVSAEYGTAADGEPVLVVRGAANEGYVWTNGRMVSRLTDAINQWTVDLAVNPDHIAQDPMNAVSGGGELTECLTLVTCDPVVLMENGMPCSSDIVHGKVIVTATTNAYGGENAPTARSPFAETNGVPPDESDVDFTSYAFQAERSL